MEDFTWSPERELSAHSLTEEEEVYEVVKEEGEEEGDEEEGKEEKGEEEDDDEGGLLEGDKTVGRADVGAQRPFVLPSIWTVNDFYSTMSLKVFKTLCDCYQIPEHILIRLPRKFERCYLGKMADVGMYDAMFIAGLRLPLTNLHR